MPFPETISVIVTAWRRRQFLEEALSSVRVGVGSPVELVVVSDFHDGDLEREVQGRHGKWVVSQEERWGAMIADGIRAARGSIIALLDDDYLFYRAWCSSAAIVVDARPLTAVRLHSENTTPTRFQGRRARFARLALIAPDLSADAETILAVVGPGVWDIPLRQMSSMGVILSASRDSAEGSRRVAGAALELLRRRRIWLPRWILVTLALVRIGSRHGAQAFFNWLTIPR